jgi:poly-gamma-glutamate system protein
VTTFLVDRLQWLLTRTGPRLSNLTLVLLGIVGVVAIGIVLNLEVRGNGYGQKRDAAEVMARDTALIRSARQARNLPINEDEDANGSGLIGLYTSPLTTDRGSLRQKLTATNPGVAAAVIDLLDQAHIGHGDVVAVGMTGSFPGLNLAVLDALQLRGARTLEIASVGASNWGANEPLFTWLDMQQVLLSGRRTDVQVLGASLGGGDDNGKTMTQRGRTAAVEAISRNGIDPIAAPSIEASVSDRMRRYSEAAAGRKIKLYINVGGGVASVGPIEQKLALRAGLNRAVLRDASRNLGVAYDFLRGGTAVLQLRDVGALAKRYQLPEAPSPFPRIGVGPVYRDRGLQTLSAIAALVVLGAATAAARVGVFERLWVRLGWRRAED